MAYYEYKSKKIYYEERGSGTPLVFLHGNTASSKMFESIMTLYSDEYKVITIDFLGHGKSQRLEEFPLELWFDEAMQTIALLDYLSLKNVNLLGTSGGAYGSYTDYLPIPEGTYKISLYVAGTKNSPVLANMLTVNKNSILTVAAVGTLSDIELLAITDANETRKPGKAMIRFSHLSPNAPAVDITLPNGTVNFSNISFKHITSYIDVVPMNYTLQVRVAGTSNVVTPS